MALRGAQSARAIPIDGPVVPGGGKCPDEKAKLGRISEESAEVAVAVVGTGFSGIGVSVALANAGIEHVVLERAEEVGGTWRDNSYPGCRCDVPSHLYSFSFALNPLWSETYSGQQEIWDYLRNVAERFEVTSRTVFGAEVLEARWDPAHMRWQLHTTAGDVKARVLVMANGPLAEPSIPDVPGLAGFEGTVFHSARWRHDHDLDDRKVAVIGTGASAIQFVPEIAAKVEHLTVFQRTPAWVLPHRTRPITRVERALYRRIPLAQLFVRGVVYWTRELFARGLLRNGRALGLLEKIARKHLERQVPDPTLRRKLTPEYRPGCKRLLLSNDWYRALQRQNVDVVTDKIVEIAPDAVLTADGARHEVDTIVFGTGFLVTDNPVAKRVFGSDGRSLADRWSKSGAHAYLGSSVPGFPNMFLMAGPNTGIGHTSLVVMIEAQTRYILDALRALHRNSADAVELRESTLEDWISEVQENASRTVWNTGGCSSWYLDEHGNNTTLWPDHSFNFVRRTRGFDAGSYDLLRRAEPDRSGKETMVVATGHLV